MPKILIMDDDLNVLRLGREEMQEAGWEVITAETGKDALDLVRGHADSLNLITLDILMPDIDGISVLRKTTKYYEELKLKRPLIFMLTAYEYRDDFAVWASDYYILKSSGAWQEIIEKYNLYTEKL